MTIIGKHKKPNVKRLVSASLKASSENEEPSLPKPKRTRMSPPALISEAPVALAVTSPVVTLVLSPLEITHESSSSAPLVVQTAAHALLPDSTLSTLPKAPRVASTKVPHPVPISALLDEPKIPHLPRDILQPVFSYLGMRSLGNVAQVCRLWNECSIEAFGDLCVKGFGRYIGDHAEELQKKARKLEPGTPEWRKVQERLGKECRDFYGNNRHTLCTNCFEDVKYMRKNTLYPQAQLCNVCQRLEPYNCLTLTNARKYFKFGNKRVQKHLHHKLPTYSFTMMKPWGDVFCTLYKLTDIFKLAKTALGEEKALKLLRKYRREQNVGMMVNGESRGI